MVLRSQGRERVPSGASRWSKWTKYAAVGVASLAVVASDIPTAAAAANPALAAAHFRGQQSHATFLQAQSPAQAFSMVQYNAQRRLDTNSTLADAENKATEVGASVRKAVKQLRGGTDKFYNDLIAAIKITLCEQIVKKDDPATNPKVRFVDPSDKRAYKDSNGQCVRVKDSTETRCEVKPNCYWGEVYANSTDRYKVYGPTEPGAPRPDGAMSASDAIDYFKTKWLQGLMIFVVPGVILGVLSLLTMIFFLTCRCCCNRCGGRSPKEGGYTCMQKFWPLLFYLLFSAGVLAVGGVSMLYQKPLTDAVSAVFQNTSDTLGGANSWIGNISSPLVSVRDTVDTSVTNIKTQLDGTDFINDGLTGLTDRLKTFGGYSANRVLPDGCDTADKYCIPCEFCTTISTEVDKSTTQIEANAGDGVTKLKSVKKELNEKLVDIADSVKSMVGDQIKMLDSLSVTVTDVQDKVDDVHDQYDKLAILKEVAVLVPFILALVTVVIGLVGILFGLTPLKFLANIIHIAYFIGFLALFITFLVSAALLAVSVGLNDVCEMAVILQKDWTVALGSDAKGINACFTGTSLIETFNLTSSLEFARGGIDFPNNNLDKMLNFSDLDAFADAIKATDESTFDVDPTQITDLLTGLNELVGQNSGNCNPDDDYDEADLLEPWTKNGETQTGNETPEEYIEQRYATFDVNCAFVSNNPDPKPFTCDPASPCTFSLAVKQLFHGAKMLKLVVRDSSDFVDKLHTNVTVVTDYTADFTGKIKVFDGKIGQIKSDLQRSLIKDVDDFERAMYCPFIKDGYYAIYESICGKFMPSLTMVSLMTFLAGVFLFPVNVCLIIACKRLKARGNGGHIMDNEMKFK